MTLPVKVTAADVDRSYDLLALLTVCAFAADRLERTGDDRETLSASLALCLKLAGTLAGSTHDQLEEATRTV